MIGPFGNMFPYTDLHSLNLDWIIHQMKEFIEQYTNIQKLINDTTNEDLAKLEQKKDDMIVLLNAWYATHSEDIAHQLTLAMADLVDYTNELIETIPADYSTVANMAQDTVNSLYFNLITTESGTFQDADGTTKTTNAARRRNKTPIPVAEIAYIEIPSGYEMYTYCLDSSKTEIGTVTWTNTELSTKNISSGTYYINIVLRKIADPTDDISDQALKCTIIKKNNIPTARWNVADGGLYIDGNSVVVNENGFTLLYHNESYTIAPVDLSTVTRFTATTNDIKTLAINTTLLTPNVRNEPATVMVMYNDIPFNVSNDKFIPVAFYYKNYWEFSSEFTNIYSVTKMTREPDYVSWNNVSGGIYINGFSVVVNKNGFCYAYNGHTYYVAPTDMSSDTTFTPDDTTSTYVLVIDPLLANPGVRTNPSDCMSVVAFRGTNYSKQYITVAVFYKGTWEFNGKFRNLDCRRPCPVNNTFNQQHLIAHKGGNTQTANTIANFEDAISNGYKFVEADVQITSDNIPVLNHDSTFTVDDTSYTIAELTYEQLHVLAPDMPTLASLLQLCKINDICIDLDCSKRYSSNAINTIYNCVKSMGCMSRVMFTSFVQPIKQILNYGEAIVCLSQIDTAAELDQVYDIINRSALCVCSVADDDFTEETCELIHSYGALVKVWTIDVADDCEDAFNAGADMIITDSVKESDLYT